MRWPFSKREPQRTASDAARELGQIARNNDRERRRAMCNQIRADLRAKGRADMTPINWSAL